MSRNSGRRVQLAEGGAQGATPARPPTSVLIIPLALRGRFILSFVAAALATYALFDLVSKQHYWRDSLYWFWFTDLPRLSGLTRIYIYGGLFLTAMLSKYARPHLGDSPLQAPALYSYTLPRFFSLEGAMKLIYSERWVNYNTIHLVRTATVVSFVCCILGVGGQFPPVIVGFGMLFLHGIVQGCIGTSHRWYVPVYTCLILMFANGNSEYSIDAYLYSLHSNLYPFPPVCTANPASVLCTGFSRKLILMAGMSTLFFGAITKMLNGGWQWLDGASLSYYVSSEENGRSMALKNLMHRFRFISLLLSLGSIGLEGVAFVPCFVSWTRWPVIVSAAGLHLGIWLTMWPNYFPQTLCYALGAAWLSNVETYYSVVNGVSLMTTDYSPLYLAAWGGVFLWFFLSMVAVTRIEYWPLTGIPMYSFYRDLSYSYRHLRDATQAQLVALEHKESGYPNAIAWSNLWITLRLKNTDPAVIQARHERKAAEGLVNPASDTSDRRSAESNHIKSSEKEFVNLKSRVTETHYTREGAHGVYLKQWRRTLHNIAALDMAEKEWGHIEDLSATSPASIWLRELLPHLRVYAAQNDWKLPAWVNRTGELQLRVKLKDRYVVLARVPWSAVGGGYQLSHVSNGIPLVDPELEEALKSPVRHRTNGTASNSSRKSASKRK